MNAAPDTMESHMWWDLQVRVVLAYYRAWRAIHALFLSGEPFAVMPDAIIAMKGLAQHDKRHFISGLSENVCWQWAEYLSVLRRAGLEYSDQMDYVRSAANLFDNGIHMEKPSLVFMTSGESIISLRSPIAMRCRRDHVK